MTSSAENVVTKMIETPLINIDSFMDFMFDSKSFLEDNFIKSHVHLQPRFKIAKTVINNLKMLESNKRTSLSSFPLKNLQNRLVESTNKDPISKELILEMYHTFGYTRIEDFIQRLDLKLVAQIADQQKTPEMYQYLETTKNAS